MRKIIVLPLTFGLMMSVTSLAWSEDDAISGEASVGALFSGGRKDSAKAEEYRDLSAGVTSDVRVRYADPEKGDYASFAAENVARKDQQAELSGGRYGDYRVEMSYSQIPHRYSYGASTIYADEGSGSLSVADGSQAHLGAAANSADLVQRLNQVVAADEEDRDLKTLRKTGKLKVEYSKWNPFRFELNLASESRDGYRPTVGSFGFGNTLDLFAPMNYNTTQLRFTGDYTTKSLYLAGSYYLSAFQNEVDSLRYDNPFRLSDSTAQGAISHPRFLNGSFLNDGAARGVQALAPDSLFHGGSLTAVVRQLPWRSQVTLLGSLGWMLQDNPYLPYTSNAAVLGTGAAGDFLAADAASLPTGGTDTSVSTALYSIGLTSHPLPWLDATAKYRYYDYDNTTDRVTFPGYVIADAAWTSGPVTTNPASYTKQNAALGLSARVSSDTRLGLSYAYANTHRDNREVARQADNVLGASVDYRTGELLNLRASYEKSYREAGDYQFGRPYGDEEMPSQLPLLRKYDEASRDMDSVRIVATVTPNDDLDLTGGFLYSNSNYDESAFGLLDDRSYQISGDADYSPVKWLSLKASYSYENHQGSQAARQWVSGSLGDPYLVDTNGYSTSNWTADTEDKIHTVGASATVTLIAKKLFFDLNYAYIMADGSLKFDSPLGADGEDANAFVPGSYGDVDSSRGHRVNPSFRYRVTKEGTISVGYLWEKYSFDDYQQVGFSPVPTNAEGNFNGALLSGASLLQDYEVNMFYASYRCRF